MGQTVKALVGDAIAASDGRLGRAEVARGPGIDSAMPVARLYEEATVGYYAGAADPSQAEDAAKHAHLRISREVIGYAVHGPGGPMGLVADFALDENGWRITELVVDSSTQRAQRRIAPARVRAIDWKTREIRVGGEAEQEAEALIRYAKELNVTPEELRSAVQRGGRSLSEVVAELRRRRR